MFCTQLKGIFYVKYCDSPPFAGPRRPAPGAVLRAPGPWLRLPAQDPLLEVEPARGVDLHDDGAVVECFNHMFLKEFSLLHIFGL